VASGDVSALDTARQDLLLRRLAGRSARPDNRARGIPAADRSAPLRLSFGQQQLWFLHRLEPDSSEYLVPMAVRLTGPLSVAHLESALSAVVGRHEILRTRYVLVGGEAEQVVDPPAGPLLTVTDVTDHPADDRERLAAEILEREAGAPIDLERAWPLRVRLLRLAEREHLLLLVFHHIAFDAWSSGILTTELAEAYDAARAGRAPALPALPIQYADFAAWERARLPEQEGHVAYWTERLAGLTPLELPADRPRPALRGWAGAVHGFPLPPLLADRLRALAARHDTTLYTVLLTAFNVVLARYTGRQDIAVGTVVSGRTRAELQPLIGYGVNSLVIRTRWSGDPTFAGLLGECRAAVAEAFDHQDVSFATLVDRLQPDRDMSRTPLFQVLFTMRGDDGFELPGLTVTPVPGASQVSRFDLSLVVVESPGGAVRAELEYATALFDPSTMERLARHYLRVLDVVADDPASPVHTMPLLDQAELDVALADWRRPLVTGPRRAVQDVFADRVAADPHAIAVVFDDLELTYADLNAAANRVAHALRSRGVVPGDLVGLCLDPGLDLVAALLGVVKSGAAYLPLDPAQPAERLAYILGDAGAAVLVTSAARADHLGAEFGGQRLVVDGLTTGPDHDPPAVNHPDDLLYVIYTSGSTGKPKGTGITHYSVLRLLTATEADYRFGPGDVWTMFHSSAFDVSVWEMWGALLYGGRLVVVPQPVSRSPEDYLDLLVRHQVTVLNQTPTAFRSLVGLAAAGDPRMDLLALRVVVFGGERLDIPQLRPWIDRFGLDHPRLINMYGITETTVHVTYHRITAADLEPGAPNTVGSPMADLRICLLDSHGELVPVGVPGEMHVGGPGVAVGYLGRSRLTAERFGPDPFGPAGSHLGAGGERLYRSGDLARRRPDGRLDFLGRIDQQVKLRGFRIEPGEIEEAISRHPAIRDVTVQLRADNGDPRLVAYLVATDGGPEPSELRELLRGTLPDYMVPAAFVRLPVLPLTVNGKLDRAALPAPDRSALGVEAQFVAPRDEVERLVAVTTGEVLGVARVGAHDGFFELGGDSIRAVTLVGALRAAGLDVSVRDVFEARTVGALAELIGGRSAAGDDTYVEPFALITPADRAVLPAAVVDAYPLSRVQAGMVTESLVDDELRAYHNVTSYRVLDETPFALGALRAAIDVVVGRHEVLRTGIDTTTCSVPLQLVHQTAEVGCTERDLRHLDAAAIRADIADFMAAERRSPFPDLSVPGLLRFTAHVTGDGAWWVTVTEHHAILEGWSHHGMLMELLAGYRAIRAGARPAEPPLPRLRYADFIAAELRSLADEEERRHWQGIVADHPAFTLPTGLGAAAEARATHNERSVPFADLEPALRKLAASVGAPLKSVLLAAHLKVLSQLTDEREFHTGLVLHGRPEVADAEQVYGMFLNTLPLVYDGGATWRDRVERVFARESTMWAHRRFPMPAIQQEAAARTRLIDTLFIYLDFHQVDLAVVDYLASLDDSPTEFPLVVQAQLGHVTYVADPRVLDQRHVDRLATIYRAVLEAMAANPEGDAGAAFLPPGERSTLLEEFGRGADTPDSPFRLHQVFEQQVAVTPDATAVVSGATRLSFAELNGRANRLARELVARGVGPEDAVALALPRSAAFAVAALATMKAGGAFVPIDPDYPEARIIGLLADAAPATVVTTADVAGTLPLALNPVMIDLAGDCPAAHRLAGTDLTTPAVAAEHPAYVIYTSGSTGVPNGVVVTHRGVVDLLNDHRTGFYDPAVAAAGKERLRVAMSSAVTFDASILGLLWMVAGHELHLVSDECRYDPKAFVDYVAEAGLDALDVVTPSFAEQLFEAGLLRAERRPTVVTLGGEALAGSLQDALADPPSDVTIWNFYGPTECTVDACRFRLDGRRGQTIGRPNLDTRIYVLDANLAPVPIGATGHIYLAGRGLARGYLHRPALTADRFGPDPFGAPGARMYRTGDLGRWLPDGNLEYRGRADEQVKIRGFRIEPGEIEAVLARCPGVAQAVVVARTDGGEHRLVGYAVPRKGSAVDPAELRHAVAAALPAHMALAAVVVLDALPTNHSGKLDRKALPAPDFRAAAASRAPRTDREEQLCALFAEVLGVERVGIDDDFFDLGGHSLLAIRLVSRIREAFDIDLPLRAVFDAATVAALDREVEAIGRWPRLELGSLSRPERLPLSFGQQRLWFMDRFDGPTATYTIPVVQWLHGPLDPAALDRAVRDVQARHESLRTVFPETDGQPEQLVVGVNDPRLGLTVRNLPPDEIDAAVRQTAGASFDLATEPPLRAVLFPQSPTAHVLLLVLHHIAGDGWSMGPLFRDLSQAYAARVAGAEPGWAPLPVQYADYTLWQREVLRRDADPDSPVARQVRYWSTVLDGLPDQLDLPTDHPRPGVPTYRGDSVPFALDAQTHRALVTLARRHRASLFMVLHAALAATLARVGAGTDVPVGAPIAGRADTRLDDLVGFFVNMLVLRTDTGGEPSFRQLLDRVRAADLAAYGHQDLPFERIVELLGPPRVPGRHPLFQVALTLQDGPLPQPDLAGVSVVGEPGEPGPVAFDLTFTFQTRQNAEGRLDGIDGDLQFALDLFEPVTAGRLASYLARFLVAVAVDPDQPVSRVEILDEREREQVVRQWNDTDRPVPDVLVTDLFEDQVRATPDVVAVAAGLDRLTFAQLNADANRLARLLVRRSPALVLAILAVLKAGAAFVPIDPDYPNERVTSMLGDASASVVLVTTDVAGSSVGAAIPESAVRIVLDEIGGCAAAAGLPDTDLVDADRTAALDPAHLAYVIYTSGSTGAPKGVAIPHRGVVNLFHDHRVGYYLPAVAAAGRAHFRVALSCSVAFDATVAGLLWMLAGHELHLVPDRCRYDPHAFVQFVGDYDIGLIDVTPSYLEQLIEAGLLHGHSRPAVLVVAGEAMSETLLNAVAAVPDDVAVYNFYGATECTVDSTRSRINGRRGQTVGRPNANTRIYVLDADLQPVPVGAPGEIYIAGAGLARGYRNRPDLTADRFVPSPFGGAGERMYRTGDLGRWLPDGNLQYRTRVDDQIKIRGFRIEPGEIEAVLARHPAVRQASVQVRTDRPGDKRLVAYVVPTADARLDPVEVRRHVAGHLPDHMVPAAVVPLAAFPMTPNGKFDRAALPAPDWAAVVTDRAPRTPRESVLRDLFAEVLGLERIGVDDNFFDLGGHSLLATRLVARIRAATGADLPVRLLFEAPTVAALAERLGDNDRTAGLRVLLPLRTDGDRPPLFCVHPAGGLAWPYAGLLPHLDSDQPVYGLQARAYSDRGAAHRTTAEMAADYVAQMRTVQPAGPYHLLGWSAGGRIAHEMAMQLVADGQQVRLLAMLDSPASARLEQPDLRRLATDVLTDFGLDPLLLGEEQLTFARLAEVLRGTDTPLAEMDEPMLWAAFDVYRNQARISLEEPSGRFPGDVVFFSAELEPGREKPLVSGWPPYVQGRIDHHPLACLHREMVSADVLSTVASEIRKVLSTSPPLADPRELEP
jgi:amino acid adenylation domain-containing protein